ncbi:FAD dependent oxidoreductase [Aureococcus anophagefferens]|nr:FAD dependent oxidoreductase [Aureococcus anophagefferens]
MGEDSDDGDSEGGGDPALQSTEAMMRLMMCVGGEEGKTYDEVVSHHYRPCELTPADALYDEIEELKKQVAALDEPRRRGDALPWQQGDDHCAVPGCTGASPDEGRRKRGTPHPFGCAIHGGGDGILVLEDCFRAGAETLRGGKLARGSMGPRSHVDLRSLRRGGSSTHALLVHGGLVDLARTALAYVVCRDELEGEVYVTAREVRPHADMWPTVHHSLDVLGGPRGEAAVKLGGQRFDGEPVPDCFALALDGLGHPAAGDGWVAVGDGGPVPPARACHCTCAAGASLVVAGGLRLDAPGGTLTDVWVLDAGSLSEPAAWAWSRCAVDPAAVRRPPAWRDDDGSSNGPWVFGVGYGAALAGPPVAVSQRVPTRGTAFALWRCSCSRPRADNGLDLYLAGDGGRGAPAPEAPAPEARTAASKPAIAGPECTSRIVMELNRKERRKLAAEAAKAAAAEEAAAVEEAAKAAKAAAPAPEAPAPEARAAASKPAIAGPECTTAEIVTRTRRLSTVTECDTLGVVCVVGAGPLGSAAARHLLELGAASVVVLDGAASAATRRRGSHHDGARLIRAADAEGDEVWSRRNAAALAAFPALEAASGVPFFTNSGALVLGPEAFVARAAPRAGAALERLGDAASRYPFLAPREGCGAACVDGAAGWIDPDAMIRAQLAAAARAHPGKLEVLAGVAVEVSQTWEGVRVATDAGEDVLADRCVICAGAHTRTLAGGLDGVVVSRRTVALLEVSEATAAELSRSMPTIKYCFELASADGGGADEQSRVEAASVYVLPPVRYEDLGGGWFVKVGGGPNDPMAEDPGSEAIDAWLATEGDAATADWLAGVGRELLAGVAFVGDGHRSKACVTTIGGTDVRVAFAVPRRRVAAVSLCCGKALAPRAIGREIAAVAVASRLEDAGRLEARGREPRAGRGRLEAGRVNGALG